MKLDSGETCSKMIRALIQAALMSQSCRQNTIDVERDRQEALIIVKDIR